jgi:hypothetical protein
MVISHVSGTERIVVLSSPKTDDRPESLALFARHLKESFTEYRSGDRLTDQETERVGFHGRLLTFDVANEKNAFDCELFVFPDGQFWWGLLHAKSRKAPAATTSAFDVLRKSTSSAAEVVSLPPFRVKDVPLSKFPITFDVIRSADSKRVSEIVITALTEGSSVEREGTIQVGDRIIAINGRKTQEFAAGVGKDSELGRIFLNRGPGDQVELELLSPRSPKPYTVTLRIPALSFLLAP